MEDNIIDAIYLGNLNPNERMQIKDPEFLRLENNVVMLESQLGKQLDTYGSMNALEARLRFIEGFRIGAQIILDVMTAKITSIL